MPTIRAVAKSARPRGALATASVLLASLAVGTWAALPAQASLSGSDWVMQTLPPNFVIGSNIPSFAPVSCVPGTGFCVVVAGDTALLNQRSYIEQADLVTTDGGQTWAPYTGLPQPSPTSLTYYNAIACPTTSVCWVAGAGDMTGSGYVEPVVAESTDGGQTWTVRSPVSWATGNSDYWANSIDCVSSTTCWIAGTGPSATLMTPFIAETTDSGATWTTFQNLPSFTLYDPNGTYTLNSIWCASALSCVAAGGLDESDGQAQVISTSDGGATWSLSPDPTLHGLQGLWGISCVPVPGGLPTCHAAAAANSAAGPVVVTSTDGGTTWSGQETVDNTGWMSAISCADAQHCWAAGAGTKLGLLGTADGGSTWSAVASDTSNEYGQVSCATTSFCVATTDGALWVTTDGGGSAAALAAARTVTRQVTIPLPRYSASTVYARTSTVAAITGKYRGTGSPRTVKAVVVTPSGTRTTSLVPIGLNKFYSLKIASVPTGITTVTFTASGTQKVSLRLVGHPGRAPKISALSALAGPAAGGARLTITGAYLSGVTAVYVGGRKATNVKVISSTKLRVTTPPGSDARYVRVLTAKGGLSGLTGRAIYNYLAAPALTGVAPSSGPTAGGNAVTVTGTGLAYVKAVSFGSNPASNVVVISPQEIDVTAPAGSGTVDIRVRTAGGTTAIMPADRYTY